MVSRQRLGMLVLILGWACAFSAFAMQGAAVETKPPVASLQLVPADAAFYWAKLRGREEVELIAKSHAWAKLMDMPSLQMGIAFLKLQAGDPTTPMGQFRQALEDPEVAKAIDLAREMFSDEFFIYGDKSCAEMLELLQDINAANRSSAFKALGEIDEDDPASQSEKLVLSMMMKCVDRIKTPEMVAGFKIKNKALAAEELAKLEELVKQTLEENPDFKGKFERRKVGKDDFLTLTFDGSMLPLDEMPEGLKEHEENEGDVDKFVAQVRSLKCTIAVGVRGDFLLAAVGPSTKVIERLGQGKSLAQSPQLKPLAKFADKRLLNVYYISKGMMRALSSPDRDIDSLVDLARGVLGIAVKEEKLTEEQAGEIENDAAALADDIKKNLAKPAAAFGFNFLLEKGIEGYSFTGMVPPTLDGSKPLTLLEHVGADPMLAVTARGKHSPADYEKAVKWVKKAYGYFEEYALPEMNDDERATFDKVMEIVKPAAERMDKANRELLLPATADGQVAMVLDARLKGKKFHEAMPEASAQLALPQPALVLGISDRKKFVAGLKEYRAAINDALDACRKIEDSEIPDWLRIPEAEKTEAKSGDVFSFAMPKDWGLDKRLAATLGVSDDTAVFALTKGHAQRLLAPKPLKAAGVFGDAQANRPRMVAQRIDIAGMIETLKPWIDYAFEQAAGEDAGMAAAAAQSQVQTAFDVLTVFRTLTSESYMEDGLLVTHSLLEITDLPE